MVRSDAKILAHPRVAVARLAWETALYALSILATIALGLLGAAALVESAVGARAPWTYAAAVILFVVTGLQLVRWTVMLGLAMFHNLAQRSDDECVRSAGRSPRVSVLMPAFNEEQTLERALRSMCELDYPDVEVIFVDDGSTDRTLEIARRFEGVHGGVRIAVRTKPNGGKWSALNHGLRHSTGELVLFVDADSHLDSRALDRLVRTMESRGAVAVAGYVRVRNRHGVLNWLQALEYLSCNGTMRAAQSVSGTVLVVAGPIGLYKRSVLERVFAEFGTREPPGEIGPMEGDTYAEDFDLSLAVLALGERIVYEPRAVAHTRAPSSMGALLNQRYRWTRGSLQVLRKFLARTRARPDLLRPRVLLWLAMCYLVDYTLAPVLALVGLPFVLAHIASGWPSGASALVLFALLVVSELAAALCFASTHRDQARLAWVLPLRGLYSSVFLMGILPFVFWDELRRAPMRW